MIGLSIQEFFEFSSKGFEVLDLRTADQFCRGFITGSINIPFDKKLKERIQLFFPKETNLLLVISRGYEEEVYTELITLGYKNIKGYLQNGYETWVQNNLPMDMIIDIEADELMIDLPYDENLVLMDVRQPMEFAEGHLKQSINIPLENFADPLRIAAIEDNDNLYLHCSGGSRSIIAASILKKHGLHNIHIINGGWKKIKEQAKAEIVKEPNVLN